MAVLYIQYTLLLLAAICPLMAVGMVILPEGWTSISPLLGKCGNNLTLDDCQGWESWEAPKEAQELWKNYEISALRFEYDARHHNNGNGIVLIYDLEGFTSANFASPAALKISVEMFTTITRFIKTISHGFAINVNFAAEAFIQLAKAFLGIGVDKFKLYRARAELLKETASFEDNGVSQ